METVYEITGEDRERLRDPRGEVVSGDELVSSLREKDFERLVCVGDRVSIDVAGSGIGADTYVVDGRIQREEIDRGELDVVAADLELGARDPAGSITKEAWERVREAVAHECTTRIDIEGEEDLLALPAILLSPPGSVLVYGQRNEGAVIAEVDMEMKKFAEEIVGLQRKENVIVGGSWDRFHAGHRYILLAAFERGERVDVGITSDGMLEEKLGVKEFDAIEERRENLENFLEAFGLEKRARVLEIDDFRGNAVEEGEALMVTEDTLKNARRINRERREREREPLDLLHVEKIRGEDGEVISSSRIREGEIDREGFRA